MIPLFPLPLVLFPKAVQPLHIFEPRYRQMLADCLASNREFGVICRAPESHEEDITPGTVGCMARVESTQPLSDGRSNIMVIGGDRFEFRSLVEMGTPYHSASVEGVIDIEVDGAALVPVAGSVREVFGRAGHAARTMQDDASALPELPEDPAELSFAVAQYVDLPLEFRQRLLTSRSPLDRLTMLAGTLGPMVSQLEVGAQVHARARTNGHGHGLVAGEA
ncbi:MAG: LON peptidase substrate-binding domain-containing protein [Cytophagaceae bacterium]|nr:LON peptidase substrate-binding domain-containing protein [Gemmatimonadaceae bacterium]